MIYVSGQLIPYFFLAASYKWSFFKMAAQKACGHDILWTFGSITFIFDVVILWVFLMIWLTFGKNLLKTKWLTEDIFQKKPPEKLLGVIFYKVMVGSHSNLMLWFSGIFWWFDYLLDWGNFLLRFFYCDNLSKFEYFFLHWGWWMFLVNWSWNIYQGCF